VERPFEQTFRDAAGQEPTLNSLARCCETIPSEVLLIPLHGFSASAEPAIGEVVRERFGRIYRLIRALTRASPAQASEMLRAGVLLAATTAARPRPSTMAPVEFVSDPAPYDVTPP
jgi:hypothetical protein